MMLYTARDQPPRMGDPARAADDRPRTFSRRIDCADGDGPRPPVNPATERRAVREAPPGRTGRRLDID